MILDIRFGILEHVAYTSDRMESTAQKESTPGDYLYDLHLFHHDLPWPIRVEMTIVQSSLALQVCLHISSIKA